MLSEDLCKHLKFVDSLHLPFICLPPIPWEVLCDISTSAPKFIIFFVVSIFDVPLYLFKDSTPLRIGGAA